MRLLSPRILASHVAARAPSRPAARVRSRSGARVPSRSASRAPSRLARLAAPLLPSVGLALSIGLAPPLAAQQPQQLRPFTAQDALEVRSVSVEEVSPDGRWVTATTATRRNRMGTDHFRFGDPTYVSPSTASFLVIDAETGEERPIFDEPVQVRGATWSPSGDRLAFLRYDGERYRLEVWDRDDGDVDEIELEAPTAMDTSRGDASGDDTAHGDAPGDVGVRRDASDAESFDEPFEIASNSTLEWSPDGSTLLLELRSPGWAEEARAAFLEMTEGPIVVQDGSDPFLDWDRVRNMGGLTRPALVDRDGETRLLLPEGEWGGFTWSEDGLWLTTLGELPLETVYEGNDGSEYRLLRIDLTTGDTLQLTEPSTDRPRPNWSPDGTRYAFSDEGHVHLRSIFRDSATSLTADFAGPVPDGGTASNEEPGAEADTTKLRFSVERWRPDGRALLVEDQRGWHLLELEESGAAGEEDVGAAAVEGAAGAAAGTLRPAGDLELVLALDEEERENGTRRNVVDWSPDGRYLWVATSERDRWERGIAVLDIEAASWQPVVADENVYGGWELSENGARLFFERSDGDQPDELYVADVSTAGSVGLPNAPGGAAEDTDAPGDARVPGDPGVAGDANREAASPGEVANVLSRALTEARALTDLNPWLDEVAITRSELVEYLDVDGETQYGILYYPTHYREGERYPLVAEIYEDYFNNGFHSGMNLVTNRGWFGFRPSVDLETGFPGEAWLKGVTAGINELIDRGLVDGDRLGVHGTSYGGYAVNLLVTQTDRFAAAINISGKVNIISFLGDSEKITTRNYRAAERGQDRIGATLWEQPHKYIEHSAVMFADRIDTPLLLLSGEGDWNVPATNQREMYYALRRLGKEVVWVNYMNAGHGAGRAGSESDFLDHWSRILDWYGTHFEKAVAEEEIVSEGGGGI